MEVLTAMLFVVTIALMIASYILQQQEVHWLTFFVDVCAMGQVILDGTLSETEIAVLIIPLFYVMFAAGWSAFNMRGQ